MRNPAINGPNARVRFIELFERAIALAMRSCETISAIRGVRAGIPSDVIAPCTSPSMKSEETVIVSVNTKLPVIRATAAIVDCIRIIMLRFSIRSTSAPPGRVKNICGSMNATIKNAVML